MLRLVCLWLSAAVASANVTMPGIFGDHMVLQQDAKLPVWGWASPGENVKVTLGGESLSTTAAGDGAWRVEFAPRAATNEAQTLTVAGQNTLTYSDVLIGDVWVASGQSNMAFGIMNDDRGPEEVTRADEPKIRLFRVTQATALEPRRGDALQGNWVVCTPTNLKGAGPEGFSGVAYYFARDIVRATGHPIGMIGTYWGGTPAEAWTSVSGLAKEPAFPAYLAAHQKFAEGYEKESVDYEKRKADFDAASKAWFNNSGNAYYKALSEWQAAASKATADGQPVPPKPKEAVPKPVPPVPPDGGQTGPGNLFNAMIAPLMPFAIKGVIWYQGEANGGPQKGPEYAALFARLITDWREKWGQGDFPFLFVQLAGYGAPAKTPAEGSNPLVREGQLRALALPATGMASAVDVGDPWNIHPKDKFDVGRRLALAARRVAYGEKLVASGPLYDSMKVEGNKIRISFRETGGGLVVASPPWKPNHQPIPKEEKLSGFGIAGRDRKWEWAEAVIDGDTVLVSSEKVSSPVAVRYGWANTPQGNLYNREALPASPFRTDDWKDSK